MQVITSKDNETIKHIRKLKDKKYRDEFNEYIIEGIRSINEGVAEQAGFKTIIVCEECVTDGTLDQKLLYEIAKYNCVYVSKPVFSSLTDVVNPQGILAVIEKKSVTQNIDYNTDLMVILDNIQDPGNLGTIIRTIDSIGLTQVILSKGSTDAYSQKVVRSTMGAIFRVNIVECDNLLETIKDIKKNKFKLIATSLNTDTHIFNYTFEKCALVVGNEGKGVSEEILKISDDKIKIPMLRKNRKPKCLCCNRYYFI